MNNKYKMKSLLVHKTKLLTEILSAGSQEDVKQLIDEAAELLKKNKLDNQVAYQLVSKIIKELDLFSPLKKNAQQWSNIKIAKIQCLRVKKRLELQAGVMANSKPFKTIL
jgi:chorismate mutase